MLAFFSSLTVFPNLVNEGGFGFKDFGACNVWTEATRPPDASQTTSFRLKLTPSNTRERSHLIQSNSPMDSLCFKVGIRGTTPSIAYAGGAQDDRRNSFHAGAAVGRTTASANGIWVEKPTISAPRPWSFSLGHPLRSLWTGGGKRHDAIAVDDAALVEEKEQGKNGGIGGEEGERGEDQKESWVLKILHVRSLWREERKEGLEELGEENESVNDGSRECSKAEHGYCDLCGVDDEDDEEVEFHVDSFPKLLRRVSLVEAKLYAKMSYLGTLAYLIPQIKVRVNEIVFISVKPLKEGGFMESQIKLRYQHPVLEISWKIMGCVM